MPEHTLPDALHPQQEDAADELQLRGGLKGRFFADFCLLQSTVDALQNYLVHAATPDVQDMAAPLLEEMKQRIFRLERLADNAADLVAQSQPPRQLNWTVQEMTVYLAQLCDAANHELEECAVTGRVRLQPMPQVADTFRSDKAIAELEAGKIVVFGGGTGNPIFSTDTASALRALEIGADAMFKATMVDGVYDKDPHKYPDAVKYDTLTFTRVLDERLAVMDSTAATLCRDNGLPIVVFDLNEPANIARALQGENVGTIVRE